MASFAALRASKQIAAVMWTIGRLGPPARGD
jgi:hypothetical protein